MQTYWLSMKIQSGASIGTTDSSADNDEQGQGDVDDSKWVEAGLKRKGVKAPGNL
jgi:hypothetical protein